jgi:hypothetical protein
MTPLVARQARAANKTYTAPVNGNWSTITWSPIGQPTNGDSVTLSPVSGNVLIIYDAAAVATSLAQLTLDMTNGGTIALAQGQGTLTVAGNEIVGLAGSGSLNLSAGTHNVNGTNGLYFGNNAGASGFGVLSGSGVLNVVNEERIGFLGSGSFSQTGGTNSTFLLSVGYSFSGTSIGSGLYTQSGGTLNVTGGEYVGYAGNGVVNQTGGTNATAALYLGNSAGFSGVYSMSNGAALTVTNAFQVGIGGSGTFNQTGGNATSISGITLGVIAGGTGTVNFSGGTLTSPSITVNNASAFHQTGGSVALSGALTLGNSAATATYTQSAGSFISPTDTIGLNGAGSLSISGGTHTAFYFYVAFNASATGAVSLSGGTLNVPTLEDLGRLGSATFTQSGGTNTVGALAIGDGVNSMSGSGIYTQLGGVLNVTQNESVGYVSIGTFNQSGGSNLAATLWVGVNLNPTYAAAYATYSMSNGASLAVSNSLSVGLLGRGAFNQSGGSASIAGDAIFGSNVGSVGDLIISGGAFTCNNECAGSNGFAQFFFSGGTHTVANGFYLGFNSGAAGSLILAGNAVLNVGFEEYVGFTGLGTITQTGGSNTVPYLTLGYNASGDGFGTNVGSGTVSLSAGTLNVTTNEVVGWYGNGVFNQTGGSHTAGNLFLGFNPNGVNAPATGVFSISNGASLAVAGTFQVGVYGFGTFNQTGGNVTASTDFTVGDRAGSAGTVNLSGGLFTTANNDYVGNFGAGTFNQFGGAHTVGNILYLGFATSGGGTQQSSGAYTLSGGTLSAGAEYLAVQGNGTFNQSGGTNTTIYLNVGHDRNPNTNVANIGIYNLSNGATLSMNGGSIGAAGVGVFNMTGGAFNVGGGYAGPGLYLGYYSTGSGTMNLSGGVINLAAGVSSVVGYNGTGVFNQSGGTHSLGSYLFIGYAPLGSGTYNLSGGNLISNGEVVGYHGAGVFSQSGGVNSPGTNALYVGWPGGNGAYNLGGGTLNGTVNILGGTFTQSDGVCNATIVNTGAFNYAGGTFNGLFEQEPGGSFSMFGGAFAFTAGGGITVIGTFPVGQFQTIAAMGPGFDIEGGVLQLGGGEASGPLLNNGTIAGFGSITGPGITNNGIINQGAGNLALFGPGDAQSSGAINLAAGRQLQLTGANLANGGSLNLNGAQVTGPHALLNTAAGILSGPGTIAAPFTNSGTILVAPGILSIQQPFINSGVIELSGLAAGLGGASLTNTGQIRGVGVATSPLTNLGTIQPDAGTITLSGAPVQNAASGLIRLPAGGAVIVSAGLAPNLGTLDLQGGTFDNNGKPLTNNGVITGFGTLSTGGLTNAPGQVITFSGALATVNGPVTNSAGATIRANFSPVLFTGPVVNNGTIKINGAPTNQVTFASTYGGAGQYISDPADNHFQDVNVLPGGLISGAAGDRFFINGTYVNAGTYSNNAGSLSAQNVINSGSLNQLAGPATMLALTGTGATTAGGGAGTAYVSVSSMSQSSVTISGGGTLTIRPAASRLTNTAVNLQINGTGVLDLSNHELLTNTSPATIKSYLTSAYDPNGNADWSQPGLTSSVAKSNPTSYSVGYANGSDPSAQDAGITTKSGTPLGEIQTIIRPVLTGDANMDGVVDFFDITQILGYKYNTGQQASYTDGDLDYSGKVDFFDIVLLLSANYNSGQTYLGAHSASPTLTGAIASATTIGTTADGKPDFEYDPATGHLRFRTDGGTFTTTGGSASFVSSLTISSVGGILLPGGASNAFATGTGATLTSTLLSSALTNSPGFTDGFDIGIVLAPGLDAATLTADLTVKYQSLNGGSLKTADVTFVPEPADLALLGLGAVGLMLGKQRRRRTN